MTAFLCCLGPFSTQSSRTLLDWFAVCTNHRQVAIKAWAIQTKGFGFIVAQPYVILIPCTDTQRRTDYFEPVQRFLLNGQILSNT